ncbi:hypothetical protein DPMN_190804 [Dreissena polymorpha]|uniref:Uncharacterized protein n=1 Tax=Dreissena polymorpha TaxID=45954 RepID=A0A9D4BEA9_DREPO|nr:hypothetical protein DPMN_190804 [Dreissena polymorpha]
MSPKTAPHLIDVTQDQRVRRNMTPALLSHKNPYWRPANDESWLGLDTSPDTSLCARLFSRTR